MNRPKGPANPEHLLIDGLAQLDRLHGAGRFADAELGCRRLLSAYPDSPALRNFLAIVLRDRGQLAEAETVITEALGRAPREPGLHNTLGNILREKKDFRLAEKSYRRAIALDPNCAEAFHNLGTVLQLHQEDEQALASFRRAIAIRPNYRAAQIEAGVQLSKLGRHQEALEMLGAVTAADPKNFAAHYYAANTLVMLDRHAEAIGELETAIRLNPQSAEAAFALGNVYSAQDRDELALRAYATAISLAPLYLDAHYAYNQLAWMLGREELNFTSYAAARAAAGDVPELLIAEGFQRLRMDDAAGAQGLLERARAAVPERADVTGALARALGLQKRFEEAAALLQDAAKADPGNIEHRRDLGAVLLQMGQAAEARSVLENVLAQSPFDQMALAYLTLTYRELGDSRFEALFDPALAVRAYELPVPPGLGEELMRLHNRKNGPFDQTLRGGTQTMGSLFGAATGVIAELRRQIEAAIDDYISAMPDQPGHPVFARRARQFSFAGSWSCRLRPGGHHTNHVHHQGWISSAYYVSLPGEVADDRHHPGWLKFGESHLALGARDTPHHHEKPAVGKLVLFPSYYWHGTVPFAGMDDRLSVAFDVVPKP